MKSWRAADVYRPLQRNVVFYEGPSMLTGDPIMAIASAQNGNRKIGRMLQLWIVPAISPIEAVKTGGDAAVCGNCKFRGDGTGAQRTCYVEYFRSVENIWQSQRRADRTDRLQPSVFAERVRGLQLRIGAYGDPVAVPDSVWRPLLAVAGGFTAYTHQWKTVIARKNYRDWCMASVDSPEERLQALALGWRTFRVRPDGGALDVGEIVCPHEQDETVHCAGCSLCRGAARPAKDIVVTVHGRGGRKWFPLAVVGRDVEARAGV